MNNVKVNREKILFGLILLVGAILLFANLGLYDIWGDEVFTFPKGRNLSEVLSTTKSIAITVHPPLYNFLHYFWQHGFAGNDVVRNRFLYALFGFVNLLLVYRLGSRFLSKQSALFATLLCATSPFLVMYSRMLRWYPLSVTLMLLTILLFERYRRSGRWSDWIFFTLNGTILIYSDYLGLVLLGSLYLYLFLHPKSSAAPIKRWLLAGLVMFILFLPWLPVLLDQIGREYDVYPEVAQKATLENPRMAQKQFGLRGMIFNSVQKVGFLAYTFTLGETTYPWRLVTSIPVLLAFLLLFLILVFKMRGPTENNTRFLFFVFTLSLIVLIVLSEVHRNFSSRTFQLPSKIMFLLPLFLLLIAQGWQKLNRKTLQVALGAIIIGVNCYGLNNYFQGQQFLNPKYLVPWRQIQHDIEDRAQSSDLVVTDEEAFLKQLSLSKSPLSVFGLVGAKEEVEKRFTEKGSYHLYILIRYRGDEQITLEGLDVVKELSALYPVVDTWHYVPADPEAAPYWKKLLGRDPNPFLVDVFCFQVTDKRLPSP
ncbi:MAG: glycosyltransferase family 39 protein [bacterium]|nr:glycosyltransferase family 39 protein [bacterium]